MLEPIHSNCIFQVEIKVLDVNDNSPEFRPGYLTANIPESLPVGECIQTAYVTDKDENSQVFVTLAISHWLL